VAQLAEETRKLAQVTSEREEGLLAVAELSGKVGALEGVKCELESRLSAAEEEVRGLTVYVCALCLKYTDPSYHFTFPVPPLRSLNFCQVKSHHSYMN
jgi:hypothetical protein